ncbi:MAG: UbiA family prenyltransferase [Bacteroidota bacterium]|nr:UbiA family prenyltransferase [Bacteroidota bacterium]
MLHRSTIQLLRFHFSFFLLPVYLFALSQVTSISWHTAFFVFLILHLLVYPSSNGYNSYMDKDETPIGGLSKPLQPTKQLFTITVVMDVLAIVLSVFISTVFAAGVVIYILVSRSYSYRGIRIKRFPITGFLAVFIFQGALIFFITYHACSIDKTSTVPSLPLIISSLLIGALYPLTQIYQHEADINDGVKTLSYVLGKKGTFIFSMCLFLLATVLMYLLFEQSNLNYFYLYLLVLLPTVLFFLYWIYKVWMSDAAADFKHSLLMNILSTLCTSIFFTTLIILNH